MADENFDSERTKEIAKALREEFHESKAATKTTISEIKDLEQDALTTLRHIMKHSDSDSLKAKVSMWCVDHLLENDNSKKTPVDSFFEEMARVTEVNNAD